MSEKAIRQSLIIHAGFHKTGTTSIQAMIERERTRLSAFARFYVKSEIGPSGDIARLYGRIPNRFTLRRFERSFTTFLENCPRGKPIVVSREQLCGSMLTGKGRWPFRNRRYDRVSLKLAQAMVRSIQTVFGSDTDITLLYTVRSDQEYIRSVYGHLLRDTNLAEDYHDFQRNFKRPINLRGVVQKISVALPQVTVRAVSLSDISMSPRGPGQVILDVLDIPEDVQALIKPPKKRNNPGISEELADQLLALNRLDMNRIELKRAKKALVIAERKAIHGW